MNIQLNTKEKTIKILEDVSFKELEEFISKLDENYKDYKITSCNEYSKTISTSGSISSKGTFTTFNNNNPFTFTTTN